MEKADYVGEGVDRLITLDLTARGVIYKLYDAARRLTEAPLTITAARRIFETIKSGDAVIITTGFLVPPQNIQETDGPLGAAALARAMNFAFNVKPFFVTEADSVLKAIVHGVGLTVVDAEKLNKTEVKHSAAVAKFPIGLKEAEEEAKRILDEHKPSLVIAVEKAGRNANREYHTMKGFNVSHLHSKVETLIEEARKRSLLTVGIGDGGNEVGMGNIEEAIKDFVPYGKICQCPCKGGIAAESNVDVLVTAAISNWGAYGVEACLALLTGKPDVLHTTQIEDSMLRSSVEVGAIDGVTGNVEPSVDGAKAPLNFALINMLEALIAKQK